MDLFHSSISLYTPYLWIVKNYGDPSVLETTPWSFNVELGITGAVASIVQLYFAHRIYLLRGRKVVWPVIVAILSTSQFAMAFAVLGEAFILRRFDRFRSFTGGVTAWLSLAVLTDILITSLLVHSLRKATRSDFQNTNSYARQRASQADSSQNHRLLAPQHCRDERTDYDGGRTSRPLTRVRSDDRSSLTRSYSRCTPTKDGSRSPTCFSQSSTSTLCSSHVRPLVPSEIRV